MSQNLAAFDRTFKDAGAGVAAQLWTAALGLVALPLIIGGLGAEHYGILSLNLSLLHAAAVGDLGVGRAVSKHLAEEGAGPIGEAMRYLETGFTITLALGLTATLALWAVTPWLARWIVGAEADAAADAFRATALAGPALLFRILLVGVLVGKRRLRRLSANNAVCDTLKIGAAVWAASAGLGLFWVVVAYVAAAYVQAGALAAQCFLGPGALERPRPRWSSSVAQELFAFGSWGTAATALRQLASQADRWVLSTLTTLDIVGYYALAREIASRLAYVPHHVARAYFPVFGRQFQGERAAMSAEYRRAQRLVVVATTGLAALLAWFATPLVDLWIGADAADRSGPLLALLAGASWAEGLAETPATALFAGAGRPQTLAKLYALAAAAQVSLSCATGALGRGRRGRGSHPCDQPLDRGPGVESHRKTLAHAPVPGGPFTGYRRSRLWLLLRRRRSPFPGPASSSHARSLTRCRS